MTTKKPVCFRLGRDALACLDALEEHCGDFASRTEIVEAAIIALWEKRLGIADTDMETPPLV